MSGEYIVHKAVELKNVHKARGLTMDHVQKHYWRQLKYDGCHTVVIVQYTGGVQFLSRTGEDVACFEHLRERFSMLPAGTYFGEAWLSTLPFAEISGIFRRKTPKPGSPLLSLYLFDYVTPAEWHAGASSADYEQRFGRLVQQLGWDFTPGLRLVETWSPEDDKFQEFPLDLDLDGIALFYQARGGYDGLICRDPDGLWERGSGKAGEIIKIKPTLRVTCRVTGYQEGLGKHAGRIGTLLVEYQGKQQGAGTGLKDHERDITCFCMNWKDKLVDIEALGVTADGYLREPRLKGVRTDVLEPDA